MKMMRKIIALAMAALMVLSLSACLHKKDEIAVTVGDVKFTSAYYMCALINAKAEAQSKVYEELSDEEKQQEVDYFSKKIDKKKFSDWVEDRAIEMLKEIAAYKELCKENKLELTKEKKEEVDQTVSYYWDSYGYSAMFEPNGVSRNTYAKYMEDGYLSELYFDYVYGKEGTKALKADDVNKNITDNYILVDEIKITYEENATDDAKAANKTTLEGYAKDIKNGKKSFIDIYKAHNKITDEQTEETDKEEAKAVNTYANILGKEDTSFASEDFDAYNKYEFDAPQVVENEGKTAVSLVIKRDISKDKYYMDYLDSFARHSIADEDFKKEISDYAKKLKVDISSYATGQFKVKEIIEPQTA